MQSEAAIQRNKAIFMLYQKGFTEKELAKKYKIKECTIKQILQGQGAFSKGDEDIPKRESFQVHIGQKVNIIKKVKGEGDVIREGVIDKIYSHVVTLKVDGKIESFSHWEVCKILKGLPV